MHTQIFGSAVFGIDAQQITIEVHIHPGVGYHLVGLPDNAVKKSNHRIAAAVMECVLNFPANGLPSIWHQQTYAKKVRPMMFPLRLAFLLPLVR